MKNVIKDFYETNDFLEITKWIKQWWIMWKLFYLFNKFNITRQKVALNLIKKYSNWKMWKVLEVGVNRWDFLIELSKSIKSFVCFYGIDVNENVMKDAKNSFDKMWLSNSIKYCNIDDWTDYWDNFFDLIVCLAVLEHVFDPIYVVKELSRIIKKDWLLVIEVPNIVVFFRRIAFLFWIRPRTSWDRWWDWWHLQYFTVNDLKRLLSDHWFMVLKVSWSWIFAWLRNWWVSMLSADIVVIAKKI